MAHHSLTSCSELLVAGEECKPFLWFTQSKPATRSILSMETNEFVGCKMLSITSGDLKIYPSLYCQCKAVTWFTEFLSFQFILLSYYAPTSYIQKLKMMGKDGQFTYTSTHLSHFPHINKMPVIEPPQEGVRRQNQLERFLVKREHNQHT
jgi:hypothetical protein